MKVGTLGPAGTFSDLAFSQFLPGDERIFFADFPEIFVALARGRIDAAFVPIKTEVREVVAVKKLQETHHFFVSQEFHFPVEYALVGEKDAIITQIFGRDEALEVCHDFLANHFGSAEKIAVSSSSVAREKIGIKKKSAAICPAHFAGNREILYSAIAVGTTTFALLKKNIKIVHKK